MECKLYRCDGSHPPIYLPDGKMVIIGRGPATKITDKKVSREQVGLTADYESKEVCLKQMGTNGINIGSTILSNGSVQVLGPGGTFNLIYGKYKYSVQFVDSVPDSNGTGKEKEEKQNDSLGFTGSSLSLKSTTESIKSGSMKRSGSFLQKSRITSFFKSKAKDDEPDSMDEAMDIGVTGKDSPLGKRKLETTEPLNVPPIFFKRLKQYSESSAGKPMDTTDGFFLNGSALTCEDLDKLKEEFGNEIVEVVLAQQNIKQLDAQMQDSDGEADYSALVQARDEIFEEDGLIVYTSRGVVARSKIAGFDKDGTLVLTQSGKRFPTSTDDWKLQFASIKAKLRKANDDGFKVVVFTNQKGLGKYNVSEEGIKKRMKDITAELGIPMQWFVSSKTDIHRKPAIGMWKKLSEKYNCGVKIDKSRSFFVGDAAGRPAGWSTGKKKDFSTADRCFHGVKLCLFRFWRESDFHRTVANFARNVQIDFKTPEEFFLDWPPAKFSWPTFDPTKIPENQPLLSPKTATIGCEEQEMIIFTGYPASGKTWFFQEHLLPLHYEHVNRDTLKTWQKCVAKARSVIAEGKSVVIDNTNPDKESRKRYLDVAKEAKIPVRCFQMACNIDQALHNNKFRDLTNTDPSYKQVATMVFYQYKNAFQSPEEEEGFTQIITVNFVPKFCDKDEEQLYFQFLL